MKQAINTEDTLNQYKTIAVVGFSLQKHKPSFYVSEYMYNNGYNILPVNPKLAGQPSGLGDITCFASLKEATDALGRPIDIVNIFRRSEDIPPVVDEAIAVKAKMVWMQLGIENQQAALVANQAGLNVIMDKCIKIEHAKLNLE